MPHKVEKARICDVPQMHRMINFFADRGEMLARPLSELYENIRDIFVVREGERVLGCVTLGIVWSDLAEVKSLVVIEEKQGEKIGEHLVKVCLEEAGELGMTSIFCFTYKPGFFEKLGFSYVEKEQLPRKVWGECYRCSKYPDCDEISMIYQL